MSRWAIVLRELIESPIIPSSVEGRHLVITLLLAGCASTPSPLPVKPEPITTPPVVAPIAQEKGALHEVVRSFISATEARQFDQVLALLALPLRDRYSAKTLERDFGADPLVSARLEQIKKFEANLVESEGTASLEWSEGRTLRLVREPAGWRITTLE